MTRHIDLVPAPLLVPGDRLLLATATETIADIHQSDTVRLTTTDGQILLFGREMMVPVLQTMQPAMILGRADIPVVQETADAVELDTGSIYDEQGNPLATLVFLSDGEPVAQIKLASLMALAAHD